jgi:hypothetical protein
MYGKTTAGVGRAPLITDDRELVIIPGATTNERAAIAGNIYHLTLGAWTTTIAAGNINAFAAAASTQFAIWNPVGSGVNLVLLKFANTPISGTLPVGGCYHSKFQLTPVLASTAVAPVTSGLIGTTAAPKAGYITSAGGSALTGSGAATLIRTADLVFTAGTVSSLAGANSVETIDGDIVIGPGWGWAPTWKAAGTTYLGGYSVTWKEISV